MRAFITGIAGLQLTDAERGFLREAQRLLEAGVSFLDGKQTQFFFVTGEDPAFVLVDAQERLIVFLDYPADPEAQPVPIWFAVRALNSLIIRSLVVSAVKNPFTLVCRGFWHLGTSGAERAHARQYVDAPARACACARRETRASAAAGHRPAYGPGRVGKGFGSHDGCPPLQGAGGPAHRWRGFLSRLHRIGGQSHPQRGRACIYI